ncbi:hypothetical protein AB1N83_003701 [Pleurotus pulmonarius]
MILDDQSAELVRPSLDLPIQPVITCYSSQLETLMAPPESKPGVQHLTLRQIAQTAQQHSEAPLKLNNMPIAKSVRSHPTPALLPLHAILSLTRASPN